MEEKELSDVLKNEYNVVAADWRFFVGIRFAVVAFAATLQSALFGAYQYVLTNMERLGGLGSVLLWSVPTVGCITVVALILFEHRTRTLYASCLERGREIEESLGIYYSGHFRRLWTVPVTFGFASHTWAIMAIYVLAYGSWWYLLYKSLKEG